MKIFLTLLFILRVAVACVADDQVDPEYVKEMEKRTRDLKERIARIDRQAKPEEGIVVYIVLEGDKLAPAFRNGTLKTLHRWEGVILEVHEVPMIRDWPAMERGGPPIIQPKDLAEFTVKSITPPVRYLQLDDGRFVEGYYDHTSQVLYQNSDSFLSQSDLPPDAIAGKLLIDRRHFGHYVKLRDGTVLSLEPVPQKRKTRPSRK